MKLHRGTGLELEGVAEDVNGQPLDLTELLPEAIRPRGARFAGVTRDLGIDQIELITDPSRDTSVHLRQLCDLERLALGYIPGLARIQYLPRRLSGGISNDSYFRSNSRLRALIGALQSVEEGGENAVQALQGITNICATHIHFGFTDVLSHEGVTAANLLNLVAPAALEWVHRRFHMSTYQRNECWTRFARKERLPAPRWFTDVAAFKRYFESIPCLIRPVSLGNGKSDRYVVDLLTSQRVHDGVSEGSIWWAVRIRPKYNTVEWRPLPSMQPEQVVEVLPLVDEWLHQALEAVGDQQFDTYAAAVASGCIPPFYGVSLPATEAEWWERWFLY